MNKDFELKKLSEVCNFQNGFAFKSNTFKDSGTPVIRITNIKNEIIDTSNVVYINPLDYNQDLSKYEIKNNDLLIAMSGATTGKIGIYKGNEKLLLNQRVGNFKPKDKLSKEYLFYFLLTKVEENLAISAGSAQPNLSTLQINNFMLPLFNLDIQKQIVEILDKAFESIEKAKANIEKNIENTKELFQSRLNEIFSQKGEGWEEKTLKEVCTKITDGTHQTPKYFDSGYTFLSSGNVTSGIINWDKIKYIDEKQHLEMQKRVSPQLNDILLAKNGTTGVAAIVDRDIEFDIYVSLALLRASDKLEAKYLLHFVNSPIAKKQFNKRLKGSGVPNLHLQEIREVIVPYPISKKEQLKISNYIELLSMRTKQLEKHYKQKLKNLEELKRSILQKAFSGELLNDS